MRRVVLALLLAGSCLSGSLAKAEPDVDLEREALAGLASEIAFLEIMADAAEGRSDDEARAAFDYDGLRTKLEGIREQINGHLAPERLQPKTLVQTKDED